jgi:hypothetical protein
MTAATPLDFSFEDAERAQLRTWAALSPGIKLDFFEEMVELAWRSGALTPERLALRDRPTTPATEGNGVRVEFPVQCA